MKGIPSVNQSHPQCWPLIEKLPESFQKAASCFTGMQGPSGSFGPTGIRGVKGISCSIEQVKQAMLESDITLDQLASADSYQTTYYWKAESFWWPGCSVKGGEVGSLVSEEELFFALVGCASCMPKYCFTSLFEVLE